MMMTALSDREIKRQFRVLRQTLAIHTMLRDDYSKKVLVVELGILGAAVVFCAVAFAGDDFYGFLGVSSATARIILGVASLVALFCSIVLIRVNWHGLAARHDDAATKWSETLQRFAEARQSDGAWPSDRKSELSDAYWATARSSTTIPDKKFNRCKSRYLLKCEISAWKSECPGCPRVLLWMMIRARDTWHAIRSGPPRDGAESPPKDESNVALEPTDDRSLP